MEMKLFINFENMRQDNYGREIHYNSIIAQRDKGHNNAQDL